MESRHDEETEHRGWFSRLHLSWPMLFLAGWLLYELTTQPTLGAVAVCLKFGWEDFRSAIWLRRVDPRRLRGRACFWLYLAWGLAKTACIACLMSVAFMAVSPKGPAAQGPRWAAIIEMLAWTGLTTLAGLGCANLTLGYAVFLARWGGLKLWLSRDIYRARRRNDWPPYRPSILENNRLGSLLIGTWFVLLPLVIILICILAIIVSQIKDPLAAIVGVGGSIFLVLGFPVLILSFRDRMSQWLIASHPCECWGTNAELPPDAESMAEEFANPIK